MCKANASERLGDGVKYGLIKCLRGGAGRGLLDVYGKSKKLLTVQKIMTNSILITHKLGT